MFMQLGKNKNEGTYERSIDKVRDPVGGSQVRILKVWSLRNVELASVCKEQKGK